MAKSKHLKMLLQEMYGEPLDEPWEVIVLAISEGHAMVRRPGCFPFVVTVANLGPIIE